MATCFLKKIYVSFSDKEGKSYKDCKKFLFDFYDINDSSVKNGRIPDAFENTPILLSKNLKNGLTFILVESEKCQDDNIQDYFTFTAVGFSDNRKSSYDWQISQFEKDVRRGKTKKIKVKPSPNDDYLVYPMPNDNIFDINCNIPYSFEKGLSSAINSPGKIIVLVIVVFGAALCSALDMAYPEYHAWFSGLTWVLIGALVTRLLEAISIIFKGNLSLKSERVHDSVESFGAVAASRSPVVIETFGNNESVVSLSFNPNSDADSLIKKNGIAKSTDEGN